MTTFRQWLAATPLTVQQVADALGRHRTTVHRYSRGDDMPRPEVVAAIEALTAGAVTGAHLSVDYRKRRAGVAA